MTTDDCSYTEHLDLETKVSELEAELAYYKRRDDDASDVIQGYKKAAERLEFALRMAMKTVESDGLLSLCQQALRTRQESPVSKEISNILTETTAQDHHCFVFNNGRCVVCGMAKTTQVCALTGDPTHEVHEGNCVTCYVSSKTVCIDCGADTKPGPGSARCSSCWEDRCGHDATPTQTVVAVCERCEDYDKILEQYAHGSGKTINQLCKALKEARETAPKVVCPEEK